MTQSGRDRGTRKNIRGKEVERKVKGGGKVWTPVCFRTCKLSVILSIPYASMSNILIFCILTHPCLGARIYSSASACDRPVVKKLSWD